MEQQRHRACLRADQSGLSALSRGDLRLPALALRGHYGQRVDPEHPRMPESVQANVMNRLHASAAARGNQKRCVEETCGCECECVQMQWRLGLFRETQLSPFLEVTELSCVFFTTSEQAVMG
ncbi:hypothetical protein AOLI_G00176830 [Acnodon oligacanthus]